LYAAVHFKFVLEAPSAAHVPLFWKWFIPILQEFLAIWISFTGVSDLYTLIKSGLIIINDNSSVSTINSSFLVIICTIIVACLWLLFYFTRSWSASFWVDYYFFFIFYTSFIFLFGLVFGWILITNKYEFRLINNKWFNIRNR